MSHALLLRVFWIGLYAAGLFFIVRAPAVPTQTALAAALITVAALAPGYFWCAGRSAGLPIFPLFALTYAWTYALPLLTDHPVVTRYTPDDHLTAGLAVSGFLALATLVWLPMSRPRRPGRRTLFVMFSGRSLAWLVGSFGLNALLQVGSQGGWLVLPYSTYTIVRAVLLGLSTVGAFVVAYLWGRGGVRGGLAATAVSLFLFDCVTSMTGLLLVNVLSKFVLAMLGFTLGERRLRVVPIVAVLALLVPLHYGKHQMRDEYWRASDAEAGRLTLAQYPEFFAKWVQYSAENLSGDRTDERTQSFSARASLVQLFLLAREQQQHGTPTLDGAGYAIIPSLLVPRVLAPDKPASHEGTYLLNIQYGLQQREDTRTTTIGWGLFNEAFGNFGYAGVAGLALVLGLAAGAFARWTEDAPELSARFLLAVLVLSIAFQTEFSAGVLLTSVFQSAVAVVGLVLLLGGQRVVVEGRASRRTERPRANDFEVDADVSPEPPR